MTRKVADAAQPLARASADATSKFKATRLVLLALPRRAWRRLLEVLLNYQRWTGRHREFLEVWLPTRCIFAVACLFEGLILADVARDTTSITNGAFAIVASLGALSFSAARAIKEEGESDRVLYAGERFFHAALVLIAASTLKYAVIAVRAHTDAEDIPWSAFLLGMFGQWAVGGLFFKAVLSSHLGLRVALQVLFARRERHADWDKI